MKRQLKYIAVMLSLPLWLSSCGDFGDTNIDPEHLNEENVPYTMVFTNAQHQALGSDWDVWRTGVIYASQWNQHIAAGGWYWSYGLNSYSGSYSSAYWDALYSGSRGAVRDITTVMDTWKDQPGMEQNYQIARIMRVYIMHRMTDLYGDVPYTEAGRPQTYSYPKYDAQRDIYLDMLNELEDAQANLGSGTASLGKQDLFFEGNVDAWRKFANSLMLRLGMRLSKVEPETAKVWAAKAVANGPIVDVADNCYLLHTGGSVTDDSAAPYAKVFVQSDPGIAFINKTFYDILAETSDPRIPLIMCVVSDYPTAAYTNANFNYGDSNPEIQQGLPGCYSMGPTSDYFIGLYYPEFADNDELFNENSEQFYKRHYSQPNRYTYGDPEGVTFVATAAQTNLLMAEAAYRGWISGSAKNYYDAGVRAAMLQFSQFPNGRRLYNEYLTEEAISNYLAANPYNATEGLKQINTQYWITCFCDEYETFSNWRRSGYPELSYPNLYLNPIPGVNHNLSRRFTYPDTESQINTANYEEAVGKLSKGNSFESRVWWDSVD